MQTLKKLQIWTLCFGLQFLVTTGWSQDNSEKVLLTIDGKNVMLDEFLYLYNKNYQNNPQAYSANSVNEYLSLFINFKLKVAEAQRLGYDTTQAFLQEFSSYREQLVQPYLNSEEMKEAMLKEAYTRLQQEVRVSHILLKISPYAPPEDTLKVYQRLMRIRSEIENGGDFEKLAKKFSDDQMVDLGYFTAMQMVYDFETIAYQTPVGNVSQPVRTRFGYHLLKVHNKRNARGSVKIAHIMVRATEGISEADSIAAHNKILEIARQLGNGGDWDELCRQFSDDLASREKGGSLKWISTGTTIPSFGDAAFALQQVGDMSEPVRTPYGWHIIKLLDKKALGSFNDMKSELREKLSRDSRSETMKQQFIEQLKQEYEYQENQKVKKDIFNLLKAQEGLAKGGLSKKTLFTLDGNDYSAALFAHYLSKAKIPQNDSLATVFLHAQFDRFTDEQVMAYEEKNLPAKYPAFRNLVREYREGLLLFRIMEEEIWNKAVTDTLGLQAFFNAHRNQYEWGERVDALMINGENKDLATKAFNIYQQEYFPFPDVPSIHVEFERDSLDWGDSTLMLIDEVIDQLRTNKKLMLKVGAYYVKPERKTIIEKRLEKLRAYLSASNVDEKQLFPFENMGRKKIKNQGGGMHLQLLTKELSDLEKGFNIENPLALKIAKRKFEKGDDAQIDAVPWEKGMHEHTADNRFVLVKIVEVIPPKLKELKECKGQVISDYQSFLEEQWLALLHERFKVNVFDEILTSVIQE